jgi:hypothetical protein
MSKENNDKLDRLPSNFSIPAKRPMRANEEEEKSLSDNEGLFFGGGLCPTESETRQYIVLDPVQTAPRNQFKFPITNLFQNPSNREGDFMGQSFLGTLTFGPPSLTRTFKTGTFDNLPTLHPVNP